MRIRLLIIFSLCLVLIALASIQFPTASRAKQQNPFRSSSSTQGKRPRFIPGDVLVRYRSEAAAKAKPSSMIVANRPGKTVEGQVSRPMAADLLPGLRLVRVEPEETLSAITALKGQPDVLYAEPNYIVRADATPNDTRFNQQWGLPRIGAPQVWDVPGTGTGSSSIVVAVIDEGIDITHPDLQANIWSNPGETANNGIDDDGNGLTDDKNGWNFLNDNKTIHSGLVAEDHATHVAGIIGAVGNNGQGIAGVNWNVRLMSLKFLDEDGFGAASDGGILDATNAVQYAKMMRDLWQEQGPAKGANVKVVNASFGGGEFSQIFQDAVGALNSSGILFVAAAGNDDEGARELNNNQVPHFPASFNLPNVIAVAATNEADSLSSFSHFGRTEVDLGAPGGGVVGEGNGIVSTVPTNDYAAFSGTSMAVPHVAGSAALLWAQNPNLTVKQVKDLLLLNGEVRASLVDKTLTGRRLNVKNSFDSLQETDSTPPDAVTNFQITSQLGRTINVSWTASGENGATGTASLYELRLVEGVAPNETEIPLKGVVPAAPGANQTASVVIPFRHTIGKVRIIGFDNKGNASTPVDAAFTVPLINGDPYIITPGTPAPLSTGGVSTGIAGDDKYVEANLPFSFPFFGENFTEVTISSNGALYFSEPPLRDNGDADDPPGFPILLGSYKMIAGLWEDIDCRVRPAQANPGVFRIESPTNIIFRWQCVPFERPGQINFEIELRSDGTIKTRYGSGNTNLEPTVGIGGGDKDGYLVSTHSSKGTLLSLTNAQELTFSARGQWSPHVLNSSQVDLKAWQAIGRTFAYAKLTFPDAGFRVNNWGTLSQAGNAFTVDATIERFNGRSVSAISSTANIWDLGALAPGAYTFTFKNSGTTVETLNITVSATAPPPNPLDDAREFVRWQYKDFLRREPDGPGWDHWTGEITQCSDPTKRNPGETEPQCIERKRANTSGAFFISPEFQNTGYFVIRIYRGSLGRMPFFGGSGTVQDEFTRDAATLGQGIVVNFALDPAVINANKAAFANQFVTRAEFKAIYDPLNNTQYVDKLFQTTGVMPTPADRQALIDGLNGGGETRATVLFKVVDGTTTGTGGVLTFNTTYGKAFYDNLFNAAFVQMEYFGYLLRDPDAGGYAFWLGKLNFFGNFTDAEMVKAFISSPEYRSRFGAP